MNLPPKKIAVVSDAVYPYNKGGKEKRIYDVTTRLAAQGYDVTIYCMKWWKGANVITQDGVTLHAISAYYPLYAGERRSIKEAIFFSLNCLSLINKDFDVIDVDHMPHLVLFTVKIICLLRGKKMVVTWHEVWGKEYWRQYLGAAGTLAYRIEKLSSKLPDAIISISPRTTNALRSTLGATQPIFTVPNGVDSKTISAIAPAARKSDIIFAGRLLSHKNVDMLLSAVSIIAKNNPDISALIVGDGPEKDRLKILSRQLGIEKNISFLGFMENHDDLCALMQSSRVFVLPSTREGFGIVAIEANACGIPVITIDHEKNATKDIVIHGENGLLVRLNKYKLAQAIEKVLNNPKDPAIYRNSAKKYNWQTIIGEIQKVHAI